MPRESKTFKHVGRELISLRELAELWHVDRTTVARWLKREAGIRLYVFNGARNGTKRFPKEQVERFLAQKVVKRTPSTVLRTG